jgi:tetratricopeptide (TPR) repeat protein
MAEPSFMASPQVRLSAATAGLPGSGYGAIARPRNALTLMAASKKPEPDGKARAASPRLRQRDSTLPWHRRPILAAAALVVMVLLAYAPAIRAGFVFDDDHNIRKNLTVRSLDGLRQMWSSAVANQQFYPLTYSTFWVEYHLWRLDPRGYHVVNILLHAASVLLLWRLLRTLRVPGAWLGAAMFALHPVEVESVAWIAERKNVLSLALALGAMLSYLRFSPPDASDEDEHTDGKRWRWYALALGLFVLALFSKTAVVTLPAVLLVLYWWKRGHITRHDMGRLSPFFGVAFLLGLLTVWVEKNHVGAEGAAWSLDPIERVLLAGRALWFYAGKLLWPRPLTFFYPRWDVDVRTWWQCLFPIAALGAIAVLWRAQSRMGRGPLAAVLIFAGILVPVLGFFNVFYAKFSQVADHFQYHASVALIALAAAGFALAAERVSAARAGWMPRIAALILLALGSVTYQRTYHYRNEEQFYREILAENPAAWVARQNLGSLLHDRGDYEEASALYAAALAVNPDDSVLQDGAGAILLGWGGRDGFRPGQLEEAIAHFRKACLLEPRNLTAQRSLGLALTEAHEYDAAQQQFEAVLQLDPDNVAALCSLARLRTLRDDWQQAEFDYERALRINPDFAPAHFGLGAALVRNAHYEEARLHFQRGLELDPTDAQAQFEMGTLLARRNNPALAARHYAEAARLRRNYPEAWYNLGVLVRSRSVDDAIGYFRKALELKPDYTKAQAALDEALGAQHQRQDGACGQVSGPRPAWLRPPDKAPK